MDLGLCHLDTQQAFAQSKLEDNMFVRLIEGCGSLTGKVNRLNRSLYGLKQALQVWHGH